MEKDCQINREGVLAHADFQKCGGKAECVANAELIGILDRHDGTYTTVLNEFFRKILRKGDVVLIEGAGFGQEVKQKSINIQKP